MLRKSDFLFLLINSLMLTHVSIKVTNYKTSLILVVCDIKNKRTYRKFEKPQVHTRLTRGFITSLKKPMLKLIFFVVTSNLMNLGP